MAIFLVPIIEASRSPQYPNIIAGRGCLAGRRILSGTLILKERPLFRLLEGHFDVPTLAIQHPQWNQLQALPADGVTFGHGEHYDRFMTNRLSCGMSPTPGGGQLATSGVFLRASRMNASCKPNVHAHWNQVTGFMEFRTLRNVAAREELCICYNVDRALLQTVTARRQIIRDEFGFFCSCTACINSTNESDNCRVAIRETLRFRRDPQTTENAIQALRAEGLYHFADTLNYDLYFALSVQPGQSSNAMLYLGEACNIATGMVGVDDERVRQMNARLAHPNQYRPA